MKEIIPLSAFSLVLETIKKYNAKFGAALFSKLLWGSEDKKIKEWHLDDYEHY